MDILAPADSGEKRLEKGARIDCIFNHEYFRGTVDEVKRRNHGHQPPFSMLFRVCFDDGDIRDDVPSGEIELPLKPGLRVECLFEVTNEA